MKCVDLIITSFVKNRERLDLLKKCLNSVYNNTNKDLFRLTLLVDFSYSGENYCVGSSFFDVDYLFFNKENIGLAPNLNRAIAHVNSLNSYFIDQQTKYICYLQDDTIVENGWLESLIKNYEVFSKIYNIGFASGHYAPEHKHTIKKIIKNDEIILMDWIRATNMFSSIDYWNSMMPIPIIDVETGNIRGKPSNGIGSSVDWFFIRNHKNSVCKSRKTNLVLPGLIKHAGFESSTWFKGSLIEENYETK